MDPAINFTPVAELPGWHRSNYDTDASELVRLAGQLNQTRKVHQFFVAALLPHDDSLRLYRVDTANPLEIARVCEVGSHGVVSYGDDTIPQKVIDQLAAIHARNPIIPYFADPAGFQCTFEKPISEDFAAFLDQAVTEGFEIYASEDDGSIGNAVMRDGYLHLWWD